MRTRHLVATLAAAATLMIAAPARGEVIDLGDGTVLSRDLGIQFLKDFSTAATMGYDSDGLMSWHDALSWIDHLNAVSYLGYSDWQIAGAATSETQPWLVDNYFEHVFYDELGNSRPSSYGYEGGAFDFGPFTNLSTALSGGYWLSDRPIDPSDCAAGIGCYAYSYRILDDHVDGDPSDWQYGVSAMRRSSVPEPGTFLLIGIGMAPVAVRRLRQRVANTVR